MKHALRLLTVQVQMFQFRSGWDCQDNKNFKQEKRFVERHGSN